VTEFGIFKSEPRQVSTDCYGRADDPFGTAVRRLGEALAPGGGVPRPPRHAAAYRAANIMPLEPILGAVDVSEPLQRIRTQGETEAGPIRGMHHAVRTDVERLVEELPHHRHPALAHLEDVAIGGCHRDVNACGEQN